jgi:hypothetical protein
MAFDSRGLDDYIDVAQRIAEFRVKHPEGSLQPLNPEHPFEIRELAGADKNGKEIRGTFIIYTAAAYRSPDDPRPGVGCAYEVFPGRTPYTAGSELQNAETAAWGRAIVAALAADTRAGIASQQEVRNRQAERGQSAGDVFDSAAPARPQQQQERPAARAQDIPPDETWQTPAPQEDGVTGIDADAQKFADEADQARSLAEIEGIHKRARTAGKVASLIRNPASGGTGKLAVYLDWKRKQLMAAGPPGLEQDDPWALKIEELVNPEDRDAALVELTGQLNDGEINAERFKTIEAAILGKPLQAGTGKAAA